MWRSVAALLAVGAANVAPAAARATPLEKVVTLLGDLRETLLSEAEGEAATYDKFACFCKDTMATRSEAISTGQGTKTSVEADLNSAVFDRDQSDITISEKVKAIDGLRGEISELTGQRREGLIQYEKAEVDLTAALQGMEAAIRALHAAKTATALLELKPFMGTIQRAISLAETLGDIDLHAAQATRLVSALALLEQHGRVGRNRRPHGSINLQEDPDVPTSVYEFQSGDIASTLEDLKGKFQTKKDDLDKQEHSDRTEFEGLVQTKESSIQGHEGELEKAKKKKATEITRVAELSGDLSTTSAQLLNDQGFLSELAGKCNSKARVWDTRTDARANELTALTQALQILQGMNVSSTGTFFVQRAVKDLQLPTPKLAALAAHAELAVNVSRSTPNHARPKASLAKLEQEAHTGRRAQIVALLRSKAFEAHSVLLFQMTRRAAEDPFAKVKAMIQGLIERLLKDAASEADHKGWCDKEVALAEQTRDRSAESIEELNEQLAIGEARREQLGLWIQGLQADLVEINQTLANSSELRTQEKTKNMAAIDDAKEGKKAVAEAYDVLDKYYKSAAKNSSADFAQVHDRPEVRAKRVLLQETPDAGFDGAYTGAQGAKTGIMGMLELVMSDFDEMVEQTQKAEQIGAQEFLQLETTVGASKAEKEVAKGEHEKALQAADAADSEAHQTMSQHSGKLNGALKELMALKPACFGGGMSAEERKAKRDEEMAALRQALCILDQHGLEGIEC